jgi:hypothetical protein
MLTLLQSAILRTIHYGKRYGVVYGPDKIRERLISNRVFKEEEIKKELNKLGITSYELRVNSSDKMGKAKDLADLLGKNFSDVLMVGVTGSVAAGYPKKDDDIDIVIVTRRDKLWVTRLALRIYVYINNIPHRRYDDEEKNDDFCFNLWLDEDALLLPEGRRNLNNAMDLILVRPLLNRDMTYEKFIYANQWAEKFVINGYRKVVGRCQMSDIGKKQKRNHWDMAINRVVFWPQYFYMRAKIGKGLVDLKRAFFHPKVRQC